MVKRQFQSVITAEQTLDVGRAFADIVTVNYPSYTEVGTVVSVAVLVKNTGDTGSNINVNFWWVNADLYGGVVNQDMGWSDEGDQYIAPGEQRWFNKTTLVTTPAGDVLMKARSFLTGFLWSEWNDDFDFTIEQLVTIATSLTLSFTPARVPLGGPVTCTGRLTRNDTNVGVDTAAVVIQLYIGSAWVGQTTAYTNTNGDWSKDFKAPTTAGSYRMRASYAGSAVFGATLSEILGLPVGIGMPRASIIAGAVIGGLFGFVARPFGRVASTVIGTIAGVGVATVAESVSGMYPSVATVAVSRCPICGAQIASRTLGLDVKCSNCGFVAAWIR